jgi:hypothetical protein
MGACRAAPARRLRGPGSASWNEEQQYKNAESTGRSPLQTTSVAIYEAGVATSIRLASGSDNGRFTLRAGRPAWALQEKTDCRSSSMRGFLGLPHPEKLNDADVCREQVRTCPLTFFTAGARQATLTRRVQGAR